MVIKTFALNESTFISPLQTVNVNKDAQCAGFGNKFQDDGNVSRCYSTGRPESQRRMRAGIWQLLPKKQTEYSIIPVSSALFSYRYDSFKVDRVQTLGAHWSICS
ncbi:uncharacterized protein TNCV_3189041 [Trichonephila clavipes]|nr:uncharacterized protein TNCV_3189041 [Trichonephila clavipes]